MDQRIQILNFSKSQNFKRDYKNPKFIKIFYGSKNPNSKFFLNLQILKKDYKNPISQNSKKNHKNPKIKQIFLNGSKELKI